MRELRIVGTSIESDVSASEVAEFVATQAPDMPVYVFRPTPGVIMGAAFDWTAILGIAANAVQVAGAFWAVYAFVIKRRSSANATKSPSFLLQVKAEPHSFVQIFINSDTTQEQFVQEFTQAVTKLRSGGQPSRDKAVQDSYEVSPNQVRVQPRKEP
jgi:hypothetical protein